MIETVGVKNNSFTEREKIQGVTTKITLIVKKRSIN